jgi:hypothetical protein
MSQTKWEDARASRTFFSQKREVPDTLPLLTFKEFAMSFLNPLRRLVPASAHRTGLRRRRSKRWQPQLEALESRNLLSVTAHFSGSQLVVDGDSSGNTIRVDVVGSGEFAQQRISYLAGGSFVEVGRYAGFSSLLINSGGGNDVVNVDGILYQQNAVTINGVDGEDVVNLNSLSWGAPVSILNPGGYTELNVTDPGGSIARSATVVGSDSLTLDHPGFSHATYVVNYVANDLSALNIHLGNAGNTVAVNDTPYHVGGLVTTVAGGAGVDTINVRDTTGALDVVGHSPNTTVRVGNPAHGVQGIHGQVKLQGNFDGRTTLVVDNTGDMSDHLMARQILPGMGFDIIHNLAPADIHYRGVQTGAVNIILGSGANTFTVENTNTAGSGDATTLDTGTGNAVNIVNVLGTDSTTPLTVVGHGPNTTVNVGNLADGVQDIRGNVKLQGNFSGRTTLVVDNTGDGSAHLMARQILPGDGFDYIHNLAPADISYRGVQTSAVNIILGSGANTFTVENTNTAGSGDATTLDTGLNSAVHIVNVLGTNQTTPLTVVGHGSNTTINVGNAGRVNGIQAAVTVTGTGAAVLSVDDSADPTPHPDGFYLNTYTPAGDTVYGTITGLAAAINYRAAAVANVTVRGGTADNIVGVYSTPAGVRTDLYANGVSNVFVVYTDGSGGPGGVNGPVYLHGNPNSPALSYAEYYDYASPGGQTYTLTATSVGRSGVAPVTYDHLYEMILFASQAGGNTVNVLSNAAGNFAELVVANGDQVTIGSAAPALGGTLAGFHGGVRVSAPAGSAVTVTVDDSGNASPTARDVTFRQDVYGTNVFGLADDPDAYVIYKLDAAAAVTVRGGAGNTTYHLQDFLAAVPLTLNAGGGTNTVDYSAATGNVYANLQTGVATDLAGFSNIQNVIGASGGPAGSYNILVGNGGNILTGGTGRSNVLIAGGSASTFNGGDTSDLLIAGTTSYDTNAASLQAIAAYWAGGDDFATRVANLESGTGVPLLDATQVTGNGGGNTVNCNGATDLLFANAALDTLNCDPWDTLVPV